MVDFVVTAVESRRPFIEYLRHHIPNLNVVWDQNQDPMETFMRAWGSHPENPTIFLQDDIILTKDFLIKVHEVISKHPEDVIQFFSMRKADIEIGTRWESGSSYIANLCYYLPKNVSGEVFDFGTTWKGRLFNGEYVATSGDYLVNDYLKKSKRKYLLHIPSLVEHAQVPSAIDSRRSKFRQSKTFVDPELYGLPEVTNFMDKK